MVSREPVRIRITNDHDVVEALDAVKADSVPRVVVRNGEPVAAIVGMADFARLNIPEPSEEVVARALRAVGAWKDLGGDDLAETIHRWRHESPQRPPLRT